MARFMSDEMVVRQHAVIASEMERSLRGVDAAIAIDVGAVAGAGGDVFDRDGGRRPQRLLDESKDDEQAVAARRRRQRQQQKQVRD